MKKTILLFLFVSLFIACKQNIKEADISKINGYWEIEKVLLKGEEKKDVYKVNPTIDYFEIKDMKGFRQKVMPQLDGRFTTNDIKETISIASKDGNFYISYATNFGKWEEEIIGIEDSVLILKGRQDIEYHYKRHIPFSLK